jgi:hypothetical protein
VLDSLLDALTGRRLGGALFVLAGLIVAGIVLWPGDDGGGDAQPARGVQPARIVSVPQLGLTFAYPSTWSRTVSGLVIRLKAPAGAAVLTFSSPVRGRETDRVKADTKAALHKLFAPTKIVHEGPAKLGPRKVTSFELVGTEAGEPVRALALTGSSPYRTYVVTLLTPGHPSAKTLAEVQEVLATVRLVKPRVASKG